MYANNMVDLERETAISVVDFIETFQRPVCHRGERGYPDYGLAYLQMTDKLDDLVGMTKYPEIRCPSYSTIRLWKITEGEESETKPHSVRAIDVLENLGIEFPIRYTDKVFDYLTTLYSHTLFSGNIDSYYYIRLHVRHGIRKESLPREVLINKLPFEFSYDESTNVTFLKNGNNDVGRLLYLMGLPLDEGKKSGSGLEAPKMTYLKNLLESSKLNSQHSDCARRLLYSFIEALFNSRMIKRKDDEWFPRKIYLSGNANEAIAERFADSIKDILNSLIESVDFDYRIGKRTTKRKRREGEVESKLYTPIFPLSKEDVIRMVSDYKDVIDFTIFVDGNSYLEELHGKKVV